MKPGMLVDGYWLDESRFFFMDERLDPSLQRITATPSIVDVVGARQETVVSLEALASVLAGHAGAPINAGELTDATFDMPNSNTLGVSVAGQDYLVALYPLRVLRVMQSLDGPALYSPNGAYACFVKGHDLWLRERWTGKERALTLDGTDHNCYGQESESCLSALSYRKRPAPLGLWSADSRWLLTHRVDERSVPELHLIQHVPPGGGRPVLHEYKYPFPGDAIPLATYVAINVESRRVLSFREFITPILAYSPFSIFYRMAWFGERDTAWFLRSDRFCKCVDLVRLDLVHGTGRVVVTETATAGYIGLHQAMSGRPNVRTLAGSNEVVWFSERDGWGHLYLYDASSGALKNCITRGHWLVRDIVHIDESRRRMLFTASGMDPQVDPAVRSLCAVNLDGTGFEILLSHDGDVTVPKTESAGLPQYRPFRPSYAHTGVSASGRFCAVRYSNIERGDSIQIVDLCKQSAVTTIAATKPGPGDVIARRFSALAADKSTPVHGAMFLPSDFEKHRRYPLIDYIYPGPHVTQQPQSFGSVKAAFARALAELGFVTVMLDTRGTPYRSRALHQLGYGEFLEPQLADHAAVVRQLRERHAFIDGERIGLVGYSAGGAAAARGLFDYGDVFKVGVSVCGNHDSSQMTSMWSDKYRGPGDRTSWVKQANGGAAHKLAGKLLMISGDMDENVHLSHTLGLADALIRANRDFELMIVPNAGHDLLICDGYVNRRVWDYFVLHLMGAQPPRNYKLEWGPGDLERLEKQCAQERELWL